jgi:hypothetical protein
MSYAYVLGCRGKSGIQKKMNVTVTISRTRRIPEGENV